LHHRPRGFQLGVARVGSGEVHWRNRVRRLCECSLSRCITRWVSRCVLERLLGSSEFFEAKLELGGIDFRAFVDSCVLDSDTGPERLGDFARRRCSLVKVPGSFALGREFLRSDHRQPVEPAFRSYGGLGNRRLQPTPQLHPTLLGLLCYYSCYYFRSIWPLPAPA
jgi:hypothetical protein